MTTPALTAIRNYLSISDQLSTAGQPTPKENVSESTAQADLHRIWQPNPMWQQFIDQAVAHYRYLNDSP